MSRTNVPFVSPSPCTPLARFWRYSVLRTELLRASAQSIRAPRGGFAYGDEGAALDLQGGRAPLDSQLGVAVNWKHPATLNIVSINSITARVIPGSLYFIS